MNRTIVTALILIVAVSGGAYLYTNSRNAPSGGHNMGDMSKQPVIQSHRSYELEVTSSTDNVQPDQPVTFSYKVKNDQGAILKNYQTVHEKIMHFIVVRKDLQQFQHIHPDFNQATGEFTISITFPTDGPYRAFPDFTPGDENPQNLPVTLYKDINVGDSSRYKPQPVVVDTNPVKSVDGYTITNKFNPDKPKAKSDLAYTLTVSRNGQPVTNLETYLGALGHSVILKEDTLDFIHAHAGEVSSLANPGMMEHGSVMQPLASMGPDINFSTILPEPGIYKIFTQFQHQNKVITTDYIIKVK